MNRILNVDKMAGQELNSVSAALDRLSMDSCSQVNGTPPLFGAECQSKQWYDLQFASSL